MVPTNAYPPTQRKKLHSWLIATFLLQSQFGIPWTWDSISTWLHFQQRQPTSEWSRQAYHRRTTQTPSLLLRCVYATLSCLQHPCWCPLCSLQTCKTLHLPWQSQHLCSYLAHRLPTTTPILCHQILPRRHFKSCLQRLPPALHNTLWPDRIFRRQLGRLPRHWPLYRRI